MSPNFSRGSTIIDDDAGFNYAILKILRYLSRCLRMSSLITSMFVCLFSVVTDWLINKRNGLHGLNESWIAKTSLSSSSKDNQLIYCKREGGGQEGSQHSRQSSTKSVTSGSQSATSSPYPRHRDGANTMSSSFMGALPVSGESWSSRYWWRQYQSSSFMGALPVSGWKGGKKIVKLVL